MGKDKDLKKKKKRGYDYFDAFSEVAQLGVDSGKKLRAIFHDYDLDKMPEHLEFLHEVEHKADKLKHQMMERLYTEFLPPIEREDIIALSGAMDEVIDAIEDVVIRYDMYQIAKPNKDMIAFIDIVCEMTEELYKVVDELHRYKKSKELIKHIITVNKLEQKGDEHYVNAVKALYADEHPDPLYVVRYERIYRLLEQCCDNCETAANTVESIRLKNS